MTKRPAPFATTTQPSTKRTTLSSSTSASTLNSFFPTTHRPSPPSPLIPSDPITDRLSTFIAHATPLTSALAATQLQEYVRNLRNSNHPVECSHEVLGYRIVSPKTGKSGLGGEEDWTLKEGGEDDGEKNASAVIRECLKETGSVDVGVVVSRLYGGVMLGPARFQHIRTVTLQAISRLSAAALLPTLLSRLTSLDAEIALLSPPPSSPPSASAGKLAVEKQKLQYASLDVPKAERLVAAREKRVEFLRRKKDEREEEERKEVEELHRKAEEEAEREEREGRERREREREREADEEAAREAEGI